METSQPNESEGLRFRSGDFDPNKQLVRPPCDLCGRQGPMLQYVDTKDFRGFFCPMCVSMMEQTTRDDGSSRLHPSHKRMLQEQIKFNQRSSYSEQADWLLQDSL